MGKLHKLGNKYDFAGKALKKAIGKDTYDEIHPLSTQVDTAYEAKLASEQALKDAQDPEKNPVIPIADEEEIERARRRRSARRGGGRASTVLNDDNRLGG